MLLEKPFVSEMGREIAQAPGAHALAADLMDVVKPEGAFYIFPSVSEYGMDAKTFSLKLLEDEKVACVPGTAFGPAGEGYIRCAYAADLDDIREAMTRMERFLQRLRG